MSELRFDQVSVRFGVGARALLAVNEVSLNVPHGAVVGLVGESGSGKSTLARAAVGLVPVHAGTISLDGQPVPRRGPYRPLQMVFQDPAASLNPRMSVGEAISEIMPKGLTRAQREQEVARLLELVQLNPSRAKARPGQLSGGQRQRVALARALAGKPQVIIADEITSSLDVSIQGAMLNLIRKLRAELELTMLFISHNLAVVRYVADQVAVMRQGKIVETGSARTIFTTPEHPYTRQLLAAIPGDNIHNSMTAPTDNVGGVWHWLWGWRWLPNPQPTHHRPAGQNL